MDEVSELIERMAMAAWAAHRGITKDIETRWSTFSDQAEGDHWRQVAKMSYRAEHGIEMLMRVPDEAIDRFTRFMTEGDV